MLQECLRLDVTRSLVSSSHGNAYIVVFLDFFPKGIRSSHTDGCNWWLADKLMDDIFLWHCAGKYAWQCDCGKPFISLVFKGYQRCCLHSALLTILHPSGLTRLIAWQRQTHERTWANNCRINTYQELLLLIYNGGSLRRENTTLNPRSLGGPTVSRIFCVCVAYRWHCKNNHSKQPALFFNNSPENLSQDARHIRVKEK